MEKAEQFIKGIVDNYNLNRPIWHGKRIKVELSKIDESIAEKLDYSNANAIAISVAKELNVDITALLVKYKYPVWVDLLKDERSAKTSNYAVISYVEEINEDNIGLIERIKNYANRIQQDCIILTGRTQGYVQLERHRVKAFAEYYDRILFLDPDIFIKDDCPNIFDLVPESKIGIFDDKEIENLRKIRNSKLFLLRSEAFAKSQMMLPEIADATAYEASLMDSNYDDSVIVSSKQHSDIWSPFTFIFSFRDKSKDISLIENKGWIEILIYRNGHEIFKMPKKFNQTIIDKDIKNQLDASIIRYERFVDGKNNIRNTWLNDNNIVGYKEKEPIDMMSFKIISLYHNDKQIQSIQNRSYIDFVNLNNMGSKFDNRFSESRIFYVDFDYLFPDEIKYCGITTGSWNLKYVGLNPIDQLHNWNGIRYLDENVVLCSDTEMSSRFYRDRNSVLSEVFKKITPDHISEFLELVGLEKIDKPVGVSNQIIAKRQIVKNLFDFYQQNSLLHKMQDFFYKYNFESVNQYVHEKRIGYFSELITVLWMAKQDFITMPQEILKVNWYDDTETLRVNLYEKV